MKPNEYIKKAVRSESKDYKFKGVSGVSPRVEHAVMGISTEAGELMDAVKKAKIYGVKLDKINLIEEMGDLMWYLALLADDLNVNFEEIWDKNIRKLKIRYPKKYTDNKALKRKLSKERDELEN